MVIPLQCNSWPFLASKQSLQGSQQLLAFRFYLVSTMLLANHCQVYPIPTLLNCLINLLAPAILLHLILQSPLSLATRKLSQVALNRQ